MSNIILIFIMILVTITSGSYNNSGTGSGLQEINYSNKSDEPIKGSGKGTVTNIGTTRKIFLGTATSSLMGDVNFELDYNITYETQYSGKTDPGGRGVVRAVNGEEMHITVSTGAWYINFVPDPPEVVFEFIFDITGGTGRFKKATGKVVATGIQIYIPSTPTKFDYTGTISY